MRLGVGTRQPQKKTRRVVLTRNRGKFLGYVDTADASSAETTAVRAFHLSPLHGRRLLIQERLAPCGGPCVFPPQRGRAFRKKDSQQHCEIAPYPLTGSSASFLLSLSKRAGRPGLMQWLPRALLGNWHSLNRIRAECHRWKKIQASHFHQDRMLHLNT